jgi:hypothetical protein
MAQNTGDQDSSNQKYKSTVSKHKPKIYHMQ